MKEEVLSQRLSVAASFVPPGAVTADVGADHAALSLFLLQKGIAESVVVSDIHPLPLQRARRAFEGSPYSHRAIFCLADGIRPLLKYNVDCFVVAGMGGETISAMLEPVAEKLQGKTLVFQPMSKVSHLREFLAAKGFLLEKEEIVVEHQRPFSVMKCRYDGVVRSFSPLEYLAGAEILRHPEKEENRFYFETLCKKLRSLIRGLEQGGLDAAPTREMLKELEALLERSKK